jgi:hypothetical protein
MSALVAVETAAAAPLAEQVVADDTVLGGLTQLTAAIAAGPLPPGVYEIADSLSLTADQTVVAEQPGRTIIRLTGLRKSVINVTGPRVTINGITITGGSNTNSSGGGINVARGASLTLVDSTITGNVARDGGGIYNAGSLTIQRSTIDNNRADRKGGGLRDDGTTTIVNSTFVANVASQGGAISTAGSSTITHATIVRNQSTSSSSAGVDRNGGTVQVRYSIIGANTRTNGSPASDCSGTPELIGLNLVSDASGCNPVGPVLVADTDGVGPLNLGLLTDNGGPTRTVALLDGSAALDVVGLTSSGACVSGVAADQRGTVRPFGTGCDLGAYERSELSVDVALAADTSNYPGLGENTVEVGLRTLSVENILEEIVAPTSGSIEDAALRSIALRSIALRSITVEDIALRSIAPKAAALRSIALRSIALRSIALRSIALRSIGLESVALRSIPLSEIPLTEDAGGAPLVWETLLADTVFEGVPLQSITLEDLVNANVNLDGLSLESIDLASTALRSIALRSILLQDAALRSIPVDGYTPDADGGYTSAWCTILGDLCGTGDDQLTPAEIGANDLLSIQLAGGSVDDVPVYDIPLSGLASTALRSIALRSIALRSIYIENTALRSIALRSIALRSIGDIEKLIDCANFPQYCSTDEANTFTLGDVPEAALKDTATIGDLADLPADLLPAQGGIEGLSFGDLLLGFVSPEASPWERLDLEDLRLQNLGEPPQPTFDYVATIEVREAQADLAVTLTLPPGFAIATRTDDVPITFDGAPFSRSNDDLGVAVFDIQDVNPGSYELRVPVRAGVVTGGPFTATVGVDASSGAQQDTATATTGVSVVPADGTGGSTTVASLQFDDLTLAHVSSSDDADLYEFTATASQAGGAARILLSNIPAGVDYDLAVYEPEELPLRAGTPSERLSSVREVRYDLNPLDDVYPTDEVDDIATDVPAQFGISGYVPRDLSSRRSSADEEVRIPNLTAGTTYYVAVTSYLGASSNQPYGLRLRVDDTDRLPECLATDRSFPNALPTAPLAVPTVPADANTLYITNTQWLAGEVGTTTAEGILAAATATTNTNGVIAGVVALDDDLGVSAAYAQWALAANRCSPDARNDVVREIGLLLDTLVDADVENIVILGGDGVVPMAAVPDRTAYSNETTFARDILTNGRSNEVAGTLGAGYLLSDDPYATEAGIEINSADHELYVPTRAIGRLVEDGSQILSQLKNFVTYGGRLDPSTVPGLAEATAAVTGYDFLTDGTNAVADALAAGITDVDRTLNNEAWSRDDVVGPDGVVVPGYLSLFENGGADIISPNAHYDFESLLPAANDGTFFQQSDLVTTADFTDPNAARLPDRSVIFSMGCHAGLSVSDVQLGVTALDWAELYADGDNPWLAHTTYGYGDTEIVAYSERLAELFAQQLVLGGVNGSGTLGDALRIAKQDYLASTLVLSPYDEKILQSFTYYGLPMYSVGGQDLTQSLSSTLVAQTSEEPLVVESPATFGTTIAGTLDRTPVTIDVPVGSASGPTNLNVVETLDGNYYEVGGNTVTAQYRPVQPLVDAPIPATVGTTAGFLITGLTSQDIEPFTPLYLRPTVDLDANERRIEPADGSFPATLQRVTTGGSGDQRLLVAAGQYKEDAATGGRQRLFTSISGELYEAGPGADGVGPSFSRITGNIGADDGVIFFEVETVSAAQRVVVVYREGTVPQWRSLDLFRSTSTSNIWVGGFRPITLDPVEFFVQAVDDNGDVGISSNKVENFFTTVPAEQGDLAIQLTPVIQPGSTTTFLNGYYTGPVSFRIGQIDPVTGLIVDPAPSLEVEYSVDSQPFQPYDPAAPSPIVEGDGGHVVFARDNTGSQQFLYFVIDGSAPVLTAERNLDVGDNNWAGGTVDVLLSADDIGQSGVERIEYSASGATIIDPPTTVTSDQASIPVSINGITTVTATAYDVAGNASAPVTIEVRVDTEIPTVRATAAPAVSGVGFTVTLTASDGDPELSGIDRIEYTINTGAGPSTPVTYVGPFDVTTSGTTTIVATAYDNAGNPSESATLVVDIDAEGPTLDVSVTGLDGENGWLRSPATVTITAEDTVSGVAGITYTVDDGTGTGPGDPITYNAPFPLGDGVYKIAATATDNAGNSTTESVDVKVDTTAPTLGSSVTSADLSPTGWHLATATVELSPADTGGSGIAGTTYTVVDGINPSVTSDYTVPFTLDNGFYTISATTTDRAGNTFTVNFEVKVDTAIPTVTATAAPAASGVGFTVTLTASDGDPVLSGIDRIEYTLDDGSGAGEPITYVGPFDVTTTTTIVATAYDNAGNASEPATVVVDTEGPTLDVSVTGLDGANGWLRSPATVTITAEDTASGLASTTYTIDAGAGPGDSIAYTTAFELNDGVYTVSATATDEAGNSTTESVVVKVDSIAPVLPTPTVPVGYVNTAPVAVTLDPADGGSRIARVDYTINSVDGTTNGPFPTDLTITADGTTTIVATAYDNAGNASDPFTVVVQIDTTGPIVSFQAPVPADGSNGYVPGPATVTLSAVDLGVGLDRIEYTVNGVAGTTTTSPLDLTITDNGRTTIVATAYDSLGNVGAPETLVLDVDATAPVIDVQLPPFVGVGDDILLSYVCSDPAPGSGLVTLDPVTGAPVSGCDVLVGGGAPLNTPTFNVDSGRWELLVPAGTTRGSVTFELTATDNVENTTTVKRTVRVGWRTCLLYDPTQEKNIGSNYTITVQLCDQNGNNVSSNRITLTALTVDGTIDPGPTFSGNSNDGYEFRFTRSNSAYTYNLNTTGFTAGTHFLFFTTEPLPKDCVLPIPANPAPGCSLAELQLLATNSAEFRLR